MKHLRDVKVLLLVMNREGWHSANLLYDIEVWKRACITEVYGPGFQNYKTNQIGQVIRQIYGDSEPNIILSLFTPNEPVKDACIEKFCIPKQLWIFPVGLETLITNATRIFWTSDFWSGERREFAKVLPPAKFDYCIGCFVPPYSNPKDFYSFFGEKLKQSLTFMPLPRCVDANCFTIYDIERKYDIISTGHMAPKFYPFRSLMRRTFEKKQNELGIKFHHYLHCKNGYEHNGFVREEYAKAIATGKILASGNSKYQVAMNKIFESMGCGTIYMGNRPHGHKQLHLDDGINCLFVTKNNFIDVAQSILKQPQKMEEMSRNSHSTFLEHHSIEARAKDCAKLVDRIMEERLSKII